MSPSPFRFAVRPGWHRLPRLSAVIFSGTAGDYAVESYRTTLSLKSVVLGRALYRTPRSHYLIEPDRLVLLNHGQEYALEIDAGDRTATLCLFFQPGFVEHVAHALGMPAGRQLDDPSADAPPLEVHERLHRKQGILASRLAALYTRLRTGVSESAWLEDQMYELAAQVVILDGRARAEVDAFPGARSATRVELYRRLHHARDFIESCYAQPVSVATIAHVACLSPFHFQRLFKRAFGRTPMQYLQARRLLAAARLLVESPLDVTQICLAVGFESLGSFSWSFHKHYGMPPSQYRKSAGWKKRARPANG